MQCITIYERIDDEPPDKERIRLNDRRDHDRPDCGCIARTLGARKRKRCVETRVRELRAIAERCAKLLGPGASAVKHGDVLYDERGLPK